LKEILINNKNKLQVHC